EIAPGAPDKVLGVTAAWAGANPATLDALVRALVRALAWAQAPENRRSLAALLSGPDYLGLSPEIVAAGLRTVAFGAPQPAPEQAAWLLAQMRRWGQVQGDDAAARAVYRPDLYARALGIA
ncbi:MAG TPA: ABC transporter substrate-binding protein, partial [Phenylobacterium sp.]|uniref:ABC transporter substrate-binding protein n=1 Tax=Phenylobacterium sp. TaxID=1871053 RepID=UPI002F94F1E8